MDDSQGKRRLHDSRGRTAVLGGVLLVGVCLGMMLAEKLYIGAQERNLGPKGLAAAGAASARRALSGGGSLFASSSLFGGGSGSGSGAGVAGSASTDPAAILRSTASKPRNELEKKLREVAPGGEVMIVISNMNLMREGSLKVWLECVRESGASSWLLVAIDEELRDAAAAEGIPHHYRPVVIPKTQVKDGDNHAISAMKYEILAEFLELGWAVLLSDVDIVTVQDPFKHLHRDSDVEGMSDGWDDPSAYGEIFGQDDPSMGWSRYAQGYKHMAMNSGLFYLRANARTLDLMHRIRDRLYASRDWDQSMYNHFIFALSHGDYRSPQVSVRVMDINLFMNSKVLFKTVRHLPRSQQVKPVMLHMNYHPNKLQRMLAAVEYFLRGDDNALKPFPGGSEAGS